MECNIESLQGLINHVGTSAAVQPKKPSKFDRCRVDFSKHVGVFYAILASIAFSLAMLSAKKITYLTGAETSWFRSFTMCAYILPYIIIYEPKYSGTAKTRLTLVLRALCVAVGSTTLYASVILISLPDASAVKYCSVILTPIFARLISHEHFVFVHIFAVLLSILGITLIANPFSIFTKGKAISQISPKKMFVGVLLAFVTAVCEAVAYCLVKNLTTDKVPNAIIIFNISIISFLFLLPVCVVWRLILKTLPIIDLMDLLFVFLGALTSLVGHFLLIKSLQTEKATIISVARAFDIVFSFIFQYIFFRVRPSYLTYIGSSLIILSIIIRCIYEAFHSKKKKKPNVPHEIDVNK